MHVMRLALVSTRCSEAWVEKVQENFVVSVSSNKQSELLDVFSRSMSVWPPWMQSWSLPSNPTRQENSSLTRWAWVTHVCGITTGMLGVLTEEEQDALLLEPEALISFTQRILKFSLRCEDVWISISSPDHFIFSYFCAELHKANKSRLSSNQLWNNCCN